MFHYEVVKRSITMSMDKHEKEREMVSRLLSELYPSVLKTREVGKGFERVLEYADDLELDIPKYVLLHYICGLVSPTLIVHARY